jgi:dolichol kinase
MMKRTAEVKITHFLEELPVHLHFRNDLHLMRKLWHSVMGLMIAFIYMSGISKSLAILILGSVFGFDLLMETLRLRSPAVNDKMLRFWGSILRRHEAHQMSTIPHYLASVMLAILIFPRPVATLSILYLACGDPMASLVGILYGHRGPRFADGKSWIGTAAGVMTCTFISLVFLSSLSLSSSAFLFISLMGGLAGGLAELLPIDIDDNFTIPVVSGFVLWLAFMVSGV